MNESIRDVGAQDPELKNSPIAAEGDENTETVRQVTPLQPVCYFNGQSFRDGVVVKSGTGLLRCSEGIWVSAGPADSDNP